MVKKHHMATIRKQAIISGILMYAGFGVGALNILFFTKFFTDGEYGLTRAFMDFGQSMFAFGSLGAVSVLYKFYPYYKYNLSDANRQSGARYLPCGYVLRYQKCCLRHRPAHFQTAHQPAGLHHRLQHVGHQFFRPAPALQGGQCT